MPRFARNLRKIPARNPLTVPLPGFGGILPESGRPERGERILRNIDFSSWQAVLVTLTGLALVTLIGVGIRLFMMFTIQARRERLNRQINERLRTLIAAYKILGGSFTGNLTVDPRHLRDLRRTSGTSAETNSRNDAPNEGSDRARRIRDAVEAALADVILLGTGEQVRLAERAVRELLAGRPVPTGELVVSLRAFIREALDLEPIPAGVIVPTQGPARLIASGKGKSGTGEGKEGGRKGGGMGMGMGAGAGIGTTTGEEHEDTNDGRH
jgi:hypothetical protein